MAEEKKTAPSVVSLTRDSSSLDQKPKNPGKDIQKPELKGSVSIEKQSALTRFKETFISDGVDLKEYIIWDILVPTIKRTARDIIVGCADRIFLGVTAPQPRNLIRDRGITRVQPSTNYARSSIETRPLPNKISSNSVRGLNRLNDIGFTDYTDASNLLDYLVDSIEEYGKVSVNRYLENVDQSTLAELGISMDFVTQDMGWVTLRDARIDSRKGSDGILRYYIRLPRPVSIK